MNNENYHSKSKEELHQMLKEVRAELGKAQFLKKDPSQTLASSETKRLKKEVARILTAYNNKN